ncbi:MAG UNVERIFIED_CONTAM: hypothetical protein LVR29_25180 [Microcystis novacekii LVE1205-3]|jgi:nitrate/nitrite transport system ATP-binding protein
MVVFGFAHLKINLGRIMQTFTDKTVNSSTTTQPFLLVSNVAKEYPTQARGLHRFRAVWSCKSMRGNLSALSVTPACGKSTLLNMVAGFSSPSRGQVLLTG